MSDGKKPPHLMLIVIFFSEIAFF